MSAFVVEDKTINRAVTFLAIDREGDWLRNYIRENLGVDLTTGIGRETLGQLMFSLNCDAVNQRYGDSEAKEFRTVNYAYRLESGVTRVQAFKSLQCWRYQCSEGDIEQNDLYKTMDSVLGHMAEMIVTRLPVYDSLAWA